MSCFYLSIEKNIEVFEFYKVLWAARGVEAIRADTMTEGISRANMIESSAADELLFIDIVADDVDFMPQLKILSEETNAPILIATSSPDDDEHHDALNNGADFYGKYCEKPEQNLDAVLSAITSINQRAKKRKTPQKIIAHGDILIAADTHKAFIHDVELTLTGSEMKLLHYLTINRGNVLSHRQIYQKINEDMWDEMTGDMIYSTIKRLRKKIRDITRIDYIETVRDVGYRLKSKSDLKPKRRY